MAIRTISCAFVAILFSSAAFALVETNTVLPNQVVTDTISFGGTVAVQIEPPASVTAGAQWRVNGSEWLSSEQVATNVPAGSRLVEFKSIPGWKASPSFEVRVIGNHTISNTASCEVVVNLNIGEIPTQHVYEGTPVQFRARARQLGAKPTLSMTVDASPSGMLNFDSATGLFSYNSAASDKQPFNVTFIATSGTNTISQVVTFQPIPKLPPERAVFDLSPTPPLPHAESKNYIEVNTILSSAPEPFNHQTRTTRAVTISGKTVVFQPGHLNGLYDSYNGNDDLKEINIHAETVIVRNPLRLPQTAVTIYARELCFEGTNTTIDTTPRSLKTRPAQFGNGVSGLQAGDITVYAERFYSNPELVLRFVSNGGHGQPGGLGKDGADGISRTPVGPVHGCPWPDNATAVSTFSIYGSMEYWPSQAVYDSEDWKPGNGGNAQPGGKPGPWESLR